MHPVAAFDLISSLACLAALIFLWKGWRRALPREAKLLLTALLIFSFFYGVCLFLEWSGITTALENVEDFIGALIPMWWALVLYAGLKGIREQDLRESETRYRTLVEHVQKAKEHAELRQEVFEPLFTSKAKGTGLGLTICQQIVKSHGGTIETLPSNNGAAFRIRLPRRDQQAADGAMTSEEGPVTSEKGGD